MTNNGSEPIDATSDRADTGSMNAEEIRHRLPGARGAELEMQLRNCRATKEDTAAFLAQQPPRTIPRGMKPQVLGDTINYLVFCGFIACASFCIAVVILLNNELTVALAIVIPGTTLAVLLAAPVLIYRRWKYRVLRHGILTTGVVVKAEKTGWTSSGGVPWIVTLNVEIGSRNIPVTFEVKVQDIDISGEFVASGKTVNVLVDPKNEKHIVCIDFLVTFETELKKWGETFKRPYKTRPMP